MLRAYISLGSNLEPERHLERALRVLGCVTRIRHLSTLYASKPVGRRQAHEHVSGVVAVDTDLPPKELRRMLREIEQQLGRGRPRSRHSPHTIELKLVAVGHEPLDEARIVRRMDLGEALADLAPDLLLPRAGLSVSELAANNSRDEVRPLPDLTRRLRKELRLDPPAG